MAKVKEEVISLERAQKEIERNSLESSKGESIIPKLMMILSGIILIPWQASRIVKEWIHLAQKVEVVCRNCGLRFHDKDASHCKSCGHVIYQEYDGD